MSIDFAACPCGGTVEITVEGGQHVERCNRGRLCTTALLRRPSYTPETPIAALPPHLARAAAAALGLDAVPAPTAPSVRGGTLSALGEAPVRRTGQRGKDKGPRKPRGSVAAPPPRPEAPTVDTPDEPTTAVEIAATDESETLAQRLRRLVAADGRSVRAIAKAAGISDSLLYGLRDGSMAGTTDITLGKIAEALGVPREALGPATGMARCRPKYLDTARDASAPTITEDAATAPAETAQLPLDETVPPPPAFEPKRFAVHVGLSPDQVEPARQALEAVRTMTLPPAPDGITAAHLDALESFLPPRQLVELTRRHPLAATLSPATGLAFEAVDRMRSALGIAA